MRPSRLRVPDLPPLRVAGWAVNLFRACSEIVCMRNALNTAVDARWIPENKFRRAREVMRGVRKSPAGPILAPRTRGPLLLGPGVGGGLFSRVLESRTYGKSPLAHAPI